MCTKEGEELLFIDGVEKLRDKYCKILESESDKKNHAVVIYGDTGCGKKYFCKECMKMAERKNKDAEDTIPIDMIGEFKGSNYDSEEKLCKVLEIIEYEISKEKGFKELSGKERYPQLFKRELSKWLEKTNNVLLIRFPKIEVFEEIQKYFSNLFVSNTILYFIMEKGRLVNECVDKLDRNIQYFECKPLKKGDEELIIKKYYSDTESPRFDLKSVISCMEERWSDERETTIKEFKKLCDIAYRYAEEKNIDCIKKKEIYKALIRDFDRV